MIRLLRLSKAKTSIDIKKLTSLVLVLFVKKKICVVVKIFELVTET